MESGGFEGHILLFAVLVEARDEGIVKLVWTMLALLTYSQSWLTE